MCVWLRPQLCLVVGHRLIRFLITHVVWNAVVSVDRWGSPIPARVMSRVPRCRGSLVNLLALFAAVTGSAPGLAASCSSSRSDEITVQIVDIGVDSQWNQIDETGAHFGPTPQGGRYSTAGRYADPFAACTRLSRILVMSPDVAALTSKSPEALEEEIHAAIAATIRADLATGYSDFELQLIENVDLKSYLLSGTPHDDSFAISSTNKQDLVVRFGQAAYASVGQVLAEMGQSGAKPIVFLTLGSNGTMMWSRNVGAWRRFATLIEEVTLVDGRARIADVVNAILALGDPNKLRLLLNAGDFWAPFDSIGNGFAVQSLLDRFPDITVLLLHRFEGLAGMNHISSMVDQTARFHVEQWFAGGRKENLGDRSASDIHPYHTADQIPHGSNSRKRALIPQWSLQSFQRDCDDYRSDGSCRDTPILGHPYSLPPCGPTLLNCGPPAAVAHNSDPRCDPSDPSCRASPPTTAAALSSRQPGLSGSGALRLAVGDGGVDFANVDDWKAVRLPVIRSVTIDPVRNAIVLAGEPTMYDAQGITAQDIALALSLTYSDNPTEPRFSLDPYDPRDPGGPWLKAVFMPPSLEHTRAGATLFLGDWSLKGYAMGVVAGLDGVTRPRQSNVPAYRSYASLLLSQPAVRRDAPEWARMWIVVQDAVLREANGTIRIDVKLGTKARRQVPDPSSSTGLSDIDTPADAPIARWASGFSPQIYSVETPEMARLEELAKAFVLARWMRQKGVRVDMTRVADILATARVETVSRVPALAVETTQEERTPIRTATTLGERVVTRSLRLFGGIDLSSKTRTLPDDGTVHAVATALIPAVQTATSRNQATFTLNVAGQKWNGVVLPLLFSDGLAKGP